MKGINCPIAACGRGRYDGIQTWRIEWNTDMTRWRHPVFCVCVLIWWWHAINCHYLLHGSDVIWKVICKIFIVKCKCVERWFQSPRPNSPEICNTESVSLPTSALTYARPCDDTDKTMTKDNPSYGVPVSVNPDVCGMLSQFGARYNSTSSSMKWHINEFRSICNTCKYFRVTGSILKSRKLDSGSFIFHLSGDYKKHEMRLFCA